MDLLPLHFRTFQFFGLWYDDPRSYRLVKLVHRSLVMLLFVHLSLFEVLALLSEKRSIEEYTNSLFLVLTHVVHVYKTLVFMAKNRSIDAMLDKFRLDICRTSSSTEENILAKHVQRANWAYSARMILTLFCGVMCVSLPILIGLSTGKLDLLPFDTYFFNVDDLAQYAFVYILQVLAVIAAIVTDVCLDSTPCACMILACAQLEICSHRIKHDNIVSNEVTAGDCEVKSEDESEKEYKERKALKKYAQHYVLIREIVDRIQLAFISMILPIFGSALLTLCSTIFKLAQIYFCISTEVSIFLKRARSFYIFFRSTVDIHIIKNHTLAEYFFITLYLCCLLIQIFFLCWFGNELQSKGEIVTSAIYETDWTAIKPRAKRSYWYLMLICQNKFIISFHGLCTLTLQTFIWMVKTSYGAFNLLKQVADT